MNETTENRIIVEVPAHEPDPPRVVMMRRIRMWAMVTALVVLLAFAFLRGESYDSKTVPDFLVGEWVSNHPDYSDRYITLTPTGITFGTGGTSYVKYKILGIVQEEVEKTDTIVLHFRDVAGATFQRRVVFRDHGRSMHFASQPAVIWQRSSK
jgi:hypothetical protein